MVRYRHTIKVKLSPTVEGQRAAMIVQQWRESRRAAPHITSAVLLYDALMAGDVSLLYQYFPHLAHAGSAPPALPAGGAGGAYRKQKPGGAKRAVEVIEPSDEDAEAGMLDLL